MAERATLLGILAAVGIVAIMIGLRVGSVLQQVLFLLGAVILLGALALYLTRSG